MSAFFTAFIGILGALIGSISTHLLHYINRKSDERKIINESIHYLLEVFYLVNRLNIEKISQVSIDYYLQRIKKLIPNFDDKSIDVYKEQISKIIAPFFILIVKQSFEKLNNIGKNYESMVANLATILPINAYYLREKNNLENLMQTISEYFESINIIDTNTDDVEEIKDNISKLQSSIIKTLMNDYKKDLKLELYELLKKTNRYNRYKGKKVIKRLESEMLTDDVKHKIDSFVDKIINM